MPSGFVPDEDQNYFIVQMIGPQGASLDYMTGVAKQVEARLQEPRRGPGHVFSVLGFNFAGNGANRAVIFASLTPVGGARRERPFRARRWSATCSASWARIPGALVIPFLPPPIQGQGSTGGFTFELLDKGGGGTDFSTLARGAARS